MTPDHQMIVHLHAECLGGRNDLSGDLGVRARRRGIATGMVVQKSRSVRSPLNYLRKNVRIGRKGAVIGYSLI